MTHDCYSTKRVTVWRSDLPASDETGVEEPGYAIKYADGYQSWCPLAVFERDYQPITAMSFGHAIHALKAGKRVSRRGFGCEGDADSLPFVFLATPPGMEPFPAINNGKTVKPFAPGPDSVLADDWMILGEV